MKKFFLILVISVFSVSAYSQLTIGGANVTLLGEGGVTSPFFISGNTNNVPARKNASILDGKGLYFPRVDLSLVTGFGFTLPGNDAPPTHPYATYLDGLVVYNIATTGKANVNIGNTEGTLTPGFWYYDNSTPTGATAAAKLASGTWRQLGSGSSGGGSYLWMPSFNLPWNPTLGTTFSVDLYDIYMENLESVSSTHNTTPYTGSIDPTLGHKYIASDGSSVVRPFGETPPARTDLIYIVTDYDENVINNVSITPNGILTYQTAVAGPPPIDAYVDIILKKK
jgi:hypothetical protein